MVTYRPVPEFPEDRVRIGSDGTVIVWVGRWKRWHAIKPRIEENGCLYVRFQFDGKEAWRSLARLVCRAFHGPRPFGHDAFHYPDADRHNCRADNLRWAPKGTDRIGKGFRTHQNKGEYNPRSVFTEEGVIEARQMAENGCTFREIAEYMGLSREAVRDAVRGRRWKHLPGAIPGLPNQRKIK